VDIKEAVQAQLDKKETSKSLTGSLIRTMLKDLAILKKEKRTTSLPKISKTADLREKIPLSPPPVSLPPSPPSGLPTIESIKKSDPSLDKPVKLDKSMFHGSELPRPSISSRPSDISKPDIPKPIPPLSSHLEEKRKTLKSDLLEKEKVKPVKPIKSIESEIEAESGVERNYLKLSLIGLTVIFIISGIGGFFYWWNYVRIVTPSIVYHYECQDFQCISIEGEGENQCQVNEECQPTESVEPTVPTPFISIDKTSVIELSVGQENLLFNELKTVMTEEQTASTSRRILVKIVSPTEKKYMDLATLIPALKVSLPLEIVQVISDKGTKADNYTLFSYSQSEGNRLGIIISLKEGIDLTQKLKNWETSIETDLEPFFLGLDKQPAATAEFQDNVYQEKAIRYLNFADPSLSIDYAVINDKLVITFSKESMLVVIDDLIN